jgi:hypothetical protein
VRSASRPECPTPLSMNLTSTTESTL